VKSLRKIKYERKMFMADIMTVRAPDELQKILNEQSNLLGLTRNALILQILWEWVKKNKTVYNLKI